MLPHHTVVELLLRDPSRLLGQRCRYPTVRLIWQFENALVPAKQAGGLK